MLRRLAVALALAAALAGCGGGDVRGTAGGAVTALDDPAPPPALLDLEVQREDVGKQVASVDDQYLSALSIYSLRREQVVQATLQVSRFNRQARPEDPSFRDALVTNLGGRRGLPVRVGGETVMLTQGTRQQIAVWFRGREVFILTTREDYDRPRALLRAALDIGRPA